MGYYKRFVNSPHLQPHNLINLKPSLSPPQITLFSILFFTHWAMEEITPNLLQGVKNF